MTRSKLSPTYTVDVNGTRVRTTGYSGPEIGMGSSEALFANAHSTSSALSLRISTTFVTISPPESVVDSWAVTQISFHSPAPNGQSSQVKSAPSTFGVKEHHSAPPHQRSVEVMNSISGGRVSVSQAVPCMSHHHS